MNLKRSIRKKAIFMIGIVIWILYFYQAYKLYSQIPIFVTPGSSYIIQLLEFTNFRANGLIVSLTLYFVLISIFSFITVYVYKKTDTSRKKRLVLKVLAMYLVILMILLFVVTIFLPVYVILTLLANIVVNASFYVSSVIFDSKTTFNSEDIVLKSNPYETEEDAENSLEKVLVSMNKEYDDALQGVVFYDDFKYYFEIYALRTITIDSKGDFKDYEDI